MWEYFKAEFFPTLWLYARMSILIMLFSVVFIMACEAIDPDLADSVISKTRTLHQAIFGY